MLSFFNYVYETLPFAFRFYIYIGYWLLVVSQTFDGYDLLLLIVTECFYCVRDGSLFRFHSLPTDEIRFIHRKQFQYTLKLLPVWVRDIEREHFDSSVIYVRWRATGLWRNVKWAETWSSGEMTNDKASIRKQYGMCGGLEQLFIRMKNDRWRHAKWPSNLIRFDYLYYTHSLSLIKHYNWSLIILLSLSHHRPNERLHNIETTSIACVVMHS